MAAEWIARSSRAMTGQAVASVGRLLSIPAVKGLDFRFKRTPCRMTFALRPGGEVTFHVHAFAFQIGTKLAADEADALIDEG